MVGNMFIHYWHSRYSGKFIISRDYYSYDPWAESTWMVPPAPGVWDT